MRCLGLVPFKCSSNCLFLLIANSSFLLLGAGCSWCLLLHSSKQLLSVSNSNHARAISIQQQPRAISIQQQPRSISIQQQARDISIQQQARAISIQQQARAISIHSKQEPSASTASKSHQHPASSNKQEPSACECMLLNTKVRYVFLLLGTPGAIYGNTRVSAGSPLYQRCRFYTPPQCRPVSKSCVHHGVN